MSQWTHVIGVVQLGPVTQETVENAFGVPKTFRDMWNETERYFRESPVKIPAGSEGSIVWHLQDTTEKMDEDEDDWHILGEGSLISIEGDLRDFGDCGEDVQEIAKWFINGCEELGSRWATLSIEVEFGNSYMIDYMWDKCIIHKIDRTQTLTIADLRAHGEKQ